MIRLHKEQRLRRNLTRRGSQGAAAEAGRVAVGRLPVGRGTGGPVGQPGSAVDRSRREFARSSPRAEHKAITTVYRPNAGVDTTVTPTGSERNGLTERPSVQRTRSPNSATASVRTARPPLTDDRLRPACGPDTTHAGSGDLSRAASCGEHEPHLRRRDHPPAHTLRARTHHTNRPNPRRRVLATRRTLLRRVRAWLVRWALPVCRRWPRDSGHGPTAGRPACAADAVSRPTSHTPTPRETVRNFSRSRHLRSARRHANSAMRRRPVSTGKFKPRGESSPSGNGRRAE